MRSENFATEYPEVVELHKVSSSAKVTLVNGPERLVSKSSESSNKVSAKSSKLSKSTGSEVKKTFDEMKAMEKLNQKEVLLNKSLHDIIIICLMNTKKTCFMPMYLYIIYVNIHI